MLPWPQRLSQISSLLLFIFFFPKVFIETNEIMVALTGSELTDFCQPRSPYLISDSLGSVMAPYLNGSASGSDNDVATIRAIARRKKKARLAKKPNVTFGLTIQNVCSSQGNDLNTTVQTLNHQSASDTLITSGTTSQPSEEVVPTEQLASAANTSLETAQTLVGEPVQASLSSSRPQWNRRLPARYQDVLPEGTAVIVNAEPLVEEQVPLRRRAILHIREQLKTQLNSFGLWHEYLQKPSHDPDGEVGIQDMANIPSAQDPDDDGHTSDDLHCDATLNPTQTLLTGWQNNGNSTKSNGEMDKLANFIQRPEFQVSELQGYSTHTANAKITQADENWDYNKLKDSFLETSVDIEVPSGDKNIPSKVFSIPGLLYQSPLSVIHAAFASRLANQFHYTPFCLFQTSESPDSLDNDVQRVHTNIYNSDAFIQEHYHKLCNFLVDKVTTAREYIYHKGYGIRSVYVEGLLKATSSVPTMNAFVEQLGVDFDISRMLAPDFMHEFELGVFKALFAHLIRILYARDSHLIELLDHWISCKQCAIPVFERLLEGDDNKMLMKLLYRTAEWNALAKLRMYTKWTLNYMETCTQEFGKLMHDFHVLQSRRRSHWDNKPLSLC
ncbi:hypothetical protein F5876DRAFT_70939 [Lentinula aff. lateritia]|uniref:Uncharacterized protein n=1 Tax=Lentinula aff. lateritia TaxID=2804960 RepID=A0ACC1TH58_9AGAR|nr:hypothetical protein F5876DRAFT_70939 [Lentinula aff. lateritia]